MTVSARRRRLLTAGPAVVAGHGLALLALIFAQPPPPRAPEPQPMVVTLVAPPPPPPVEAPRNPEPAASEKPPPPPRVAARPTPRPPPEIVPVAADKRASANGTDELSDAELASAGTAGSGAGGRGCDMTRRLQIALRKDARVRAAVAEAHRGKALRVWNGDWVRHGEQEGAGLAAVREAIQWEVGFAPTACRGELVHGLVLLSLDDAPGAARLVVGAGDWRWSDLLFARGWRAR